MKKDFVKKLVVAILILLVVSGICRIANEAKHVGEINNQAISDIAEMEE